jgi:hypothetical protein
MVKIGVDDQASSRVASIGNSIKSGLGTAARAGAAAMTAAVGAASAATVAMGKAALDSYASYEQLVGGVDKLFGDASGQLQQYAADAYKTTGMSANQYMTQVTGFSAALVNSLGGDTAAAAQRADVAMRAMSDNVNVFGSDMESVQMAFQGFAKQNYTMLDNLKLGYGGTKTEMERLIKDANEYAASIGEASDLSIDSFADVVTAIDLIQQKQNIAGTTAREAATTIEGSINMTKAAWENLLTEFGKEDGDVGARMTELLDSAMGAFDNILPRLETIFQSIADSLPTLAPMLAEAGMTLFSSIVDSVMMVVPNLWASLRDMILQSANFIRENKADIVSGAMDMIGGMVDALIEITPSVLQALVELLIELGAQIIMHVPDILAKAGELVLALVSGIANGIDPAMQAMNEVVQGALDAVGEFFKSMFDAGANLIQGLIEGIGSAIGGVGDAIMGGLNDAVGGVLSFLGIASPSKLFKWVGDMTMEGLTQGIEGGTPSVDSAMAAAATSMYDASDVGSRSFDSRPILEGMDALGGKMSNLGIYLDGKVLVGYIAPSMDRALVVA